MSSTDSTQELSGRVALVTGAGRGIGRTLAVRLADAGATVVMCGRDADGLTTTASQLRQGNHLTMAVDLTRPDSIAELADRVHARWPALDIIVNNSGIGGPSAPLWEVDRADWEETIAVNLTGTYLICKAFLPNMVMRRSGAIALIGSMTGKRPLLHRAPYAMTKMGLVGLCRTLALELGSYGLRVNVVSPGFVEGPRLDWVIEMQAAAQNVTLAQARSMMASDAPLNSFVTTDDVANAVLYLVSDRAAGITGADLNVSAGLTMY